MIQHKIATFNDESFASKLKRRSLLNGSIFFYCENLAPLEKKIEPAVLLQIKYTKEQEDKLKARIIMTHIRRFIIPFYGYVCMKCGAIPPDKRDLHIDHIKPKSKYPELEFDLFNMQLLCKDCNWEKSNRHETDYR